MRLDGDVMRRVWLVVFSMKIPNLIRKALLAKANAIMASRAPDFIIRPAGRDQTLRWHVIPRNRWFNIYVHKWIESDDDRALHDHPYHNASILLSGEYREWIFIPREITLNWEIKNLVAYSGQGNGQNFAILHRREGHFYIRKAIIPHRVELLKGEPIIDTKNVYKDGDIHFIFPKKTVITLFITGRRFRDWGFHCPKGWVHEDEFRDGRDKGKTGKGCD